MIEDNILLDKYLEQKGVRIIQNGVEIVTYCIFSQCDNDSNKNEGHLYFKNDASWQYDCKKCGARGNRITLLKHFGDWREKNNQKSNVDLIIELQNNLSERIKKYLSEERGISENTFNRFKIGYGNPYNKKDPRMFLTIPIFSDEGQLKFIKLRQDPGQGKIKLTYPNKGAEATLYGEVGENEDLFICEGEFDALVLIDRGYSAVTSTHGCGTWKDEWNNRIKKAKNIYVVYDYDTAGKNGSIRVLNKLFEAGFDNLNLVTLPEIVGDKGDITDYVVKHKLDIKDLKTKYAVKFPSLTPTEELTEITVKDIQDGLNATIKYDNVNKVICFLGMTTAYISDGSQQNILFNALSSTGKSHTALEVSKLFPKEDILRYDACSKKAFFHESGGEYDKEKNERIIDFTGKIMIFTDQPRPDLMAELRPLLSHDNPELIAKITDKNEQGSNATKTVILRGFPVFVYCTANSKYDEQEATRFIVLSPEIRQEKLQAGVSQSIYKESNSEEFKKEVENNPHRKRLIERIKFVKYSRVKRVVIKSPELIEEKFKKLNHFWKPRHQRDNKKIIGLVKALALLNNHNRERTGDTIFASTEDINIAFSLWESIYESQELGVSPYLADIYKKVIIPEYEAQKNAWNPDWKHNLFQGIDRASICRKYKEVFDIDISAWKLRQEILFSLQSSGLIEQVEDEKNRRNKLVKPIFRDMVESEVGNSSVPNSELNQGVIISIEDKIDRQVIREDDLIF